MGEILLSKGALIESTAINYQNMVLLFFIKLLSNKWRTFTKKNKTPLHWAAMFNSKEMGELLISKGAKINVKDISFKKSIILYLINSIT